MMSQSDAAEHARRMVDDQLRMRGITDEAVLSAMQRVPRHAFLEHEPLLRAYGDHPLPVGEGQTISQPYMVAKMTEMLAVKPGMKVLEIGTGSGYQTAVLAEMGAEVVSLERFERLAGQARKALARIMPDHSITIVTGDGTKGYPPLAPYQRILVTAGAPNLPEPYQHQLTDDGLVVIPIGGGETQMLTSFQRTEGGGFEERTDLACRFVPLLGEHGWQSE